MATRVGREYISVTLLNFLTFITLSLVQHPCLYLLSLSLSSSVIASFVLKFPDFRYHVNRGRSDENFNVAVKMPDLENPCLVQHPCFYLLY